VEKARPGAMRLTQAAGSWPDRGVLHCRNGKTSRLPGSPRREMAYGSRYPQFRLRGVRRVVTRDWTFGQ
jgi:hypothetical protein